MKAPLHMAVKYFILLCLGLSFIAAVLGFSVLAGAISTVFKCSFFAFFIAAMVVTFWPREAANPSGEASPPLSRNQSR